MIPQRVLLIGMMGVGKSTVGHFVAERLSWPYLDTDDEIARSTGFTVPEMWKARGEAAFRAEEARVLREAVTSDGPAVVSVAGGAILDPDNCRRVRSAGMVVWLRAELSTLAARVGAGEGRPLLEGDPLGALSRLYAKRQPIYADLAEVVLDVDELAPEQCADRVVAALGLGARSVVAGEG